MFPEEFKQRIATQKYVDAGSLLDALEQPSPVSIRLNPEKWTRPPLDADNVPWCRTGFYLPCRPTYTFDPLFHSGCYYPQEASGMFLEQALMQTAGSAENLRVLDLCASPGGKSTHLSSLIGPSGLLVSNEAIRARALVLSENITKWGAGNVLVTQNDPSAVGRMKGFFDVMLVDAPCSGEGMFRNRTAVSEWSAGNTLHCSLRQKRILADVWPALKENGILIYSTCTFNPGENEENIKWLLDRNKAECLRLDVDSFPGITEIDYEGIYGYGFYPGKTKGEGLFMAAVRKTSPQESDHQRNLRISDFRPSGTDMSIASAWTVLPPDRILRHEDEIIALPSSAEDYLYLFRNLKVVRSGTRIAVRKKNDYIPSFELAYSSFLKKNAFPVKDVDFSTAISYLRRDTLNLKPDRESWNILTYMDVNMGFVNNVGRRVNNYFPVAWRIRADISGVSRILPVAWK